MAVARKLVDEFRRRWECLRQDAFEDLLQECLTHWFFARDEYDSARKASPQTFMARVIRNKLTDLVREGEADKRKTAYLTVSLDAPLCDDENGRTLLDRIIKRPGTGVRSDPELDIQLKIDVTAALRKLSPKQKKLCCLVREDGLAVKEISDYLETPRSTVCDELKRIRTIFMDEGLEDYL